MNRFKIDKTKLDGLTVVTRKPLGDNRGFFQRLFCNNEMKPIIGDKQIVQINHTHTRRLGTIRGLHFQNPPYSEMKIVSCLRGRIFDVAVDLRKESPSYLCWHSEILSSDNYRSLVIPEGFAHGFQTLEDNCEIVYLHTAPFVSEAEDGIDAFDPKISIDWPLKLSERSSRDAELETIFSKEKGQYK